MDVSTAIKPALPNALQMLKQHFGFDCFRGEQENIVNDLVAGHDLLVLMPTGGGKSICYQLPALLRPGIAIVVSPLIALMEDQVTALKSQGLRANFYNSSQNSKEARTVLAQLHQGDLDLLYIAPERLLSESFLARLHECPLALFAIDEAHCISQWGHDFRPEYAALGLLKDQFPEVPLIALTATADQQTRKDIIRQLNYQPKQYIASFNRPNIYYQVKLKENPLKQIQHFLQDKAQQSGIIYCNTRDRVETLSAKLQALGYKSRPYHAGLSHQERREAQMQFRYDQIDIIVATIAFGMGIDKPNVRFVIHHDLPKTIESYYQETGRAGRDGIASHAFLLYDPGDSGKLRAWIASIPAEAQQRVEHHKLNHMLAFAEATHCRRQVLLRYFNESFDTDCAYCDLCDHPPQLCDATVDAQKLLSCIYRLRQNYGLNHVIDVLRGSESEKIKQFNHQQLSTYGIGKEKPSNYWKQLAWQLIHRDFCFQDTEHFNVLRLNQKAIPLLRGEEKISLAVQPAERIKSDKPKKRKMANAITPSMDNPLFERLRALRRRLAQEENKPPFMIFSDATLHEMVQLRPKNTEELHGISGVGEHKLVHYGQAFLEVLQKEADTVDG
jgi:ATP-dependent DNA helicase RecQ